VVERDWGESEEGGRHAGSADGGDMQYHDYLDGEQGLGGDLSLLVGEE
jgi:hypothetical protein